MPKPRLKVLTIFGTRPEAVKMAPVILELKKRSEEFDTLVAVTAQHRTMLDQILKGFAIVPDYDLNIMQPGQTLTDITHRVLDGLSPILEETSPDVILVQGDTTTVFAASLAAFYGYGAGREIAVGHVEAGLRTENKYNPYPEEMNRRLTTCLADIHFAPTPLAKSNLLRYGVREESIYITGNTVIDALLCAANNKPLNHKPRDYRTILITAHRRENWGNPMRDICRAVGEIVDRFDDVNVVFSMHKNPVVREVVMGELAGKNRVDLIEPPDYSTLSDSCVTRTWSSRTRVVCRRKPHPLASLFSSCAALPKGRRVWMQARRDWWAPITPTSSLPPARCLNHGRPTTRWLTQSIPTGTAAPPRESRSRCYISSVGHFTALRISSHRRGLHDRVAGSRSGGNPGTY